jgi:hypothetical protein
MCFNCLIHCWSIVYSTRQSLWLSWGWKCWSKVVLKKRKCANHFLLFLDSMGGLGLQKQNLYFSIIINDVYNLTRLDDRLRWGIELNVKDEIENTQVDDSGHRKSIGTGRKEAEKSLDPAGNRRKMIKHGSSIPTGIFSDFFQWFTGVSCRKEREASRKSTEKIRRLSDRNTASVFPLTFRCFSAGTGPYFLT